MYSSDPRDIKKWHDETIAQINKDQREFEAFCFWAGAVMVLGLMICVVLMVLCVMDPAHHGHCR